MTDENFDWSDIGLGDLDLSNVEAAEGFVDTVGEGIFQAVVTDLQRGKIEEGKHEGKVYAKLVYEVASGPKAGKSVEEMFWDLANPDAYSRGFMKKRFMDLGMPADYKGLPSAEQFKGTAVVITRRKDKSGKYFNIADCKRFDGQAAAVAPEAPKEETSNSFSGLFGNG